MTSLSKTSFMDKYGLTILIFVLFLPDFVALPCLVLFVLYWLYQFVKNRSFKWSFLWLFLGYAAFIALRAGNTNGLVGVVFVFVLYAMTVYYRKIMTPAQYNLMQYQITLASLFNFFFNFVNMNPTWAKPITDILDMFIDRGHLPQFREGYFRAYSTFDNPNIYAFVLMTVLLIIFNQIELQVAFKRKKETLFYCGAFVVNAYALLLTQTRSILLAVAIGMIIILVVQERWTQLKVLVFVGSIAALFLLLNPTMFPRFTQLEDNAPIRYEIWENALSQIKRNPYFGEGFFTYTLHFDNSDAHNIFIDTLLNFGIMGTFLLVLYAVEIVYSYLKDADSLDIPLALALLFAIVVYGIFDIPLYSIQPTILVTLVFVIPKRSKDTELEDYIQTIENNDIIIQSGEEGA